MEQALCYDLLCQKCYGIISTTGECGCEEEMNMERDLEFYRQKFMQLVRQCIRSRIPVPSQMPGTMEEIAREYQVTLTTQGVIKYLFLATNIVSIWLHKTLEDEMFEGLADDEDGHSNPCSRNGGNEQQARVIASSPPDTTLHIRLLNGSGDCKIEILHMGFDWEQIAHGIESNTMHLAWNFYPSQPHILEDYSYDGDDEDYETEEEHDEGGEYDQNEDNSAMTDLHPASKTIVENLGRQIAVEAIEKDIGCCSICQNPICEGEVFIRLPCEHAHHEECVVRWLSYKNFCPVCRHELPTDDLD